MDVVMDVYFVVDFDVVMDLDNAHWTMDMEEGNMENGKSLCGFRTRWNLVYWSSP